MHCELLVPGLQAAPPGLRVPALEMLLARGRRSKGDALSALEWLAGSFGCPSPVPAGALTLLAHGREPGDAAWARADPVHLRVMRDRVVLVPGTAFSVARGEAERLASDLNRHFGARLGLEPLEPGRWCARLERNLELPGVPALAMAGRGVAPGSAGDALLTEVQMVLHEHPVNEAREARGEPALNSLWLWGAGPAPARAAARWQSLSADEPVALGLARAAGIRTHRPGASAGSWLGRQAEEGQHLLVLDALEAASDPDDLAARLQALERDWFAPLLAALRAGRIGMITVHAPEARGARVETIRGDLRRLWRRPRALATWIG